MIKLCDRKKKRRQMTKPQILFIADLNEELPLYKEFCTKFEPIHYELTTKEQFISDLKSKFTGIQAMYSGWCAFHFVGGLSADIISAFPECMEVVTVCSRGFNGIDLDALKARKIKLYNSFVDGVSEQVADCVLWHVLEGFRRFSIQEQVLRYGKRALSGYDDAGNEGMGSTTKARYTIDVDSFDQTTGKPVVKHEIHHAKNEFSFGQSVIGKTCVSSRGKNVSILGFGGIGQQVAVRLASLGMNVSFFKRSPLTEAQETEIRSIMPGGKSCNYISTIEEAVRDADVVVVALPGSTETNQLVDKQLLQKFKNGSILINIGRGFILKADDVLEALQSGKLSHVGVDVYEKEPAVHPGFLHRLDVTLTPHVGSSTVETFDGTAEFCLKNIEDVILNNGEGTSRVL